MASCARPACTDPVAGLILLHQADRVAELLPLDAVTGQRYEFGLCAGHLARAKAPVGWKLIDRLSVSPLGPEVQPTRAGPVWVPSRESDVEDVSELRTATSPLLRRAFRSDTSDDDQIERG